MSVIAAHIRVALHRAHTFLWMSTRWALLAWGVFNGLGIGLLGRVERVKRRISTQLPRISGSATRT